MDIAIIPPLVRSDYLTNTVLDGLMELAAAGGEKGSSGGGSSALRLALPPYEYLCPYDLTGFRLNEHDFMGFARSADLIIFTNGKNTTNYELAERIGRWDKTAFVDGSELGKDRRYDKRIREQVEAMTYEGLGAIDSRMLAQCSLYFRREKPYIEGIIPLPFGIESRYLSAFSPDKPKDIDFCCVFGQDEYPALRKKARKSLERFCRKNGLVCHTQRTDGFTFADDQKVAGRDRFYEILSRSKAGISVGGGGFDTARFWEILGNGCLLMTETIDIYEEGSRALGYDRIWQFRDIGEFESQLEKVADFLENGYNQASLADEYGRIMRAHSSRARAETILEAFKENTKETKEMNLLKP